MRISEVCIQRPVLAWVLTFILVIVGIIGGSRLPLLQYPKIERPYVTIETTLPGAGPEIVEAQITKIIEEAVAGIEGIETVTSSSAVEESKVTLEFIPGYSMESATNNIRDRLAKFADKIPDEATKPILTQSRAEEKAIITISLTSEKLPASELADYAIRDLQKDLESIPGVARVDVLGAGQYTMHLYLNPVKMAAYAVTAHDVKMAIRRNNIEKPAGKLIGKDREYLVTTIANLESPEEFNQLVVAEREGHLVRLKDVGYAKITADDYKTRARYNGKEGVSIGVVKQSLANPLQVSADVRKWIDKVRPNILEGAEINMGMDRTTFIKRSLDEVFKTIFEATILVILVVFAFLRSFRASVIPLVTIPVSLIGALFLMYLLNFSINTLTLMALVLAVGLVVDDAIVILENVYRHIEEGVKPVKAAFKAIKEISFAVVAMTLTLAAVYAPISLAQGNIGKLFTEFSLTLAGAVIVSGFAALTLSPMMCARMLKSHDHNVPAKAPSKKAGLFSRFKYMFMSDVWLMKVETFYEEKLKQVLKLRKKSVSYGAGFALLGLLVYFSLPKEYFPREDQGYIFIEGQAPQSATLEYTDRYVSRLDQFLSTFEEVERRSSSINNPTFEIGVHLKADRKRSTQEISQIIEEYLSKMTGIEGRIESGGSGSSGEKANSIEFVVLANKPYNELSSIAQNMIQGVYRSGIVDSGRITSGIRGDTQDYTVTLQRDKVSSLNIEPATIAEMIDMLIRGQKASTFKKDNKLYDVKIEVEDKARQSPYDITNLFVKAGDKQGTLVPLSELVTVRSRSGPVEIYHTNRQRSITVRAALKKTVLVGEGVDKVKSIAKEVLPNDVKFEFSGETQRYLKESNTMILIFGLAIAFIYLIMAAQFESWIDPFIIMLSVPLSLSGAVITLALINQGSLNIYSNIGLVTLIGLITKHGIMMVDFANKRRDLGESIEAAILNASKMRLRPILMTTFAMVLGALPLAFATGAGAESRRQIGWVIVGGMSIGTIFTLFVLPAVYMYLTPKVRKQILEVPDLSDLETAPVATSRRSKKG